MNIILVTTQLYPKYIGGAEIFNYYFIKSLVESGHSVSYLSYADAKIENAKFYKLFKIKPWRIFIPLQTMFFLIFHNKKNKIFHLSYMQGSIIHWFYYPILKKLFNIKYSMTLHDPSLKEWENKKGFKKVFDHAEFIIGVSERLCEEYSSRCENKSFHYLPPLIPLHKTKYSKNELRKMHNIAPDNFIFLFAGSLKDTKRPLTILHAIEKLGEDFCKNNKLLFLFAGKGVQKEEMEDIINKTFLAKYVQLLGMQTQDKLRNYYSLSDCYIIPSIFEGKSMSLIEAMFNGLAIIGSNAPGINDILADNENSLLFEIDDYETLADKIKILVTDINTRSRLKKNAEEYYETELKYENMLKKYITLFEKTVS